MDEAARLFRRHGYVGTSTRTLAIALGVRSASLYHHIGAKHELLQEVCESSLRHITDAVTAALGANPDPADRLPALIGAHVRSALADQDKHAVMLIELRSLPEEVRTSVIRRRDAYEGILRGAIEAGQADGVLRTDIPARHLTLALLNLLNWTIFWYTPDGELSGDGLVAEFTDVFLNGAAHKV